ncbi:MAG: hypothetical protein CR993_02915 [Rhodobacterales bacterium]|nr:MAG: hypothetical protein CR993_02915 [Rhodobacterales bacterium]
MMRPKTPLMASETTAARLLDLGAEQFRSLVDEGYLLKGHEIAPGVVRWDTDMLKQISNGEVGDTQGSIEW